MLTYNPEKENMTEDEREHLLSTVSQAHAGLSAVALKLRLGLPPKTPALKTAMIKAERAAFDLKRSLQRLEVKDVENDRRRAGAHRERAAVHADAQRGELIDGVALAQVVAPGELLDVAVKMLRAQLVEGALVGAFEHAPER